MACSNLMNQRRGRSPEMDRKKEGQAYTNKNDQQYWNDPPFCKD